MLAPWRDWVATWGLGPATETAAVLAGELLFIALLSVLANLVARRIILRVLGRVIRGTSASWDDVFLERRVFDRLSHLAPALVIHTLGPQALADWPLLAGLAQRVALAYMLVIGMLVIDAFFNAMLDLYQRTEMSREKPLKGFVQVAKLVAFLGLGIVLISLLANRSPVVLLGGFGALTAVLILVFRDVILGFVASIQLTANDMVRRGDWISLPKHGADGDVIDVSLTTVKVRNWDKTISTVPTYALISESFQNWRGMEESGGRRIKRALHIDVQSIRFATAEDLARFKRIGLLKDYVEKKEQELAAHNAALGLDPGEVVNGRRMTNVGTFRAYLVAYLRAHPLVHDEMTFLVRQLAPTAQGLPLEIYVFSRDQVWANYEAIQADIFDHVLAVVPEFGLGVLQEPSGADLRALGAGGR